MRLKIAEWRWEIEANPCQMSGQERRETNYKPFFQVERFAKRSEDFDPGSDSIHGAYSETVRPRRSTPKAFGILGCFVRKRSHL